eukprot:TRINITY_DN315_c0_g4_i1.p1 TRINITY_DN315_c0_g4~~TRINITY_DN315_c0_g4_i1.p1  ORF type:complete len:278 (+),score=7.82 TRINITY_DN315_c0_g4_i1:403-1236(+)
MVVFIITLTSRQLVIFMSQEKRQLMLFCRKQVTLCCIFIGVLSNFFSFTSNLLKILSKMFNILYTPKGRVPTLFEALYFYFRFFFQSQLLKLKLTLQFERIIACLINLFLMQYCAVFGFCLWCFVYTNQILFFWEMQGKSLNFLKGWFVLCGDYDVVASIIYETAGYQGNDFEQLILSDFAKNATVVMTPVPNEVKIPILMHFKFVEKQFHTRFFKRIILKMYIFYKNFESIYQILKVSTIFCRHIQIFRFFATLLVEQAKLKVVTTVNITLIMQIM